jgi:glycosyltransferase involved in cell wall biosynthesis
VSLVANLERPLPASLPVGSASAVFCLGTCFHPDDAIEALEVVVDGVRHSPIAFAMPRPDVPQGYRSGFWASVPVAPRAAGAIQVEVAARLRNGNELVAPLGSIEAVEPPPPPPLEAVPQRAGPGLIAVCMATFEPDERLFRTQIDSLRAQTDDRWVCLISDDCSGAEHLARIREVVGDDPRFTVSRSDERLGFYRNFERALRMVPVEAELVALCDQDDRWHPDKLATLRDAIGDAQLVYSDQRLVDAEGNVLRDTLWKGRDNNHTDMASMLIANTITGAASLFRRDLLELALPFPDTPGFQFHDHWLGVLALAAGEVAYVDRPLYDYVQHAGAVFGDVSQGSRSQTVGGRFDRWRAAYFYGYLARRSQAETLLLRCADRLSPRKRRGLERFVASARSPAAFAWLAARPLRTLAGHTETLRSETELAQGILWRWLIGVRVRGARTPGRRAYDAGFPPPGSFNQKRLRRWRAQV